VALVNSFLAKRIHWQTEASSNREKFLFDLYEFNRIIIAANNLDEAINKAINSISEIFNTSVAIALPDPANKLNLKITATGEASLNTSEQAIATWVYQNGQPAGKTTYTLSSSEWYYLPLKNNNRVLGVLGIKLTATTKSLTYEQNRLLESFANTIALALSHT
jgi:two-component system sensor histidine kinase KdpD